MIRRSFLATACVAVLSVAAVAAQGTRQIVLAGAPNFRDIGGYKTSDGRTVRWGLLYRSGELTELTDADYQRLATLGISAVCDFRRPDEQQLAPTRWRGSRPPEFVTLPNPPSPAGTARPAATPIGPTDTAADVRARFPRGYRTNVTSYAPSFRMTFQRILNSTSPILYHCTAGKDRTGLFTALLLTFLGVPHATVVEDYLLTNTYIATPERVEALSKSWKASREAVVALSSADASYLDAALDEINKTFGSLDNYRRTQLGLSDTDVVKLKAKLLEP